MKHLISKIAIIARLAVCPIMAQHGEDPAPIVFGANYNTPTIAELGPVLFLPPNFQPEVQIFITAPGVSPPSWLVTLAYVDATGVNQSVTQAFISQPGSTATPGMTSLASFFVDAYTPIQITVVPLRASGKAGYFPARQ